MKPFLHGRPTGSHHVLRAVVASSPAIHPPGSGGADAPAAEDAPSPTVECVKQGDKVVRLIITCSCGERVEVECLYADAG